MISSDILMDWVTAGVATAEPSGNGFLIKFSVGSLNQQHRISGREYDDYLKRASEREEQLREELEEIDQQIQLLQKRKDELPEEIEQLATRRKKAEVIKTRPGRQRA